MNQALPKRVQDQLQAAEALEVKDQEARQAASSANPAVASAADLMNPSPTAPPTSAPPPTPAVAATPPAPPENFEQKYRTLQGMYSSEVPKLQRKLQDQDAVIAEMRNQLKILTEAKPAQPAQTLEADPNDVQTFGLEMVEMVRRVASKFAQDAAVRLEPRFAALEGLVNSAKAETAVTREEAFYALLNRLVPDWEAVNVSTEWLKWLGVKDKVFGVDRQAALDNAFNKLDANQVAEVFNAFKASLPPPPPPQDTLHSQVVPGDSGGSGSPAATTKPLLSTQAINAFYRDKARGVYAGREAEADAIEAQIDLAVAENRVR